jgi:nitrite reductase/ring-hydroxylating ferredoxin subunit
MVTAMSDRVTVGTLDELRRLGSLAGKAGTQPICVFWNEGAAFALDDRCPHMGFPLHRGTVESGLVTCHWHHARFDLSSGGTLDPWADDVRAYPVEIEDGRVTVVVDADPDRVDYLLHRLDEGLEQGITLVIAKAVLGLLEAGVPASSIVRAGVDFGTRYREAGWGAGLTVLTAMANVLDHLAPADRGLALIHGLAFVSNDTRGRAPRFPLQPLSGELPAERLDGWYRRFIETRSADAAERTLATAVTTLDRATVGSIAFAAVTDHVFIDGGHTIDFTNKAFELLDHLGWDRAADVLPTLVAQTATAGRSEEQGSWRYPHDLAALITAVTAELPGRLKEVGPDAGFDHDEGVAALAWSILADDPTAVVAAIDEAVSAGATAEELARSVAYAAALRITRFHTQNDHADWDQVHHAFTAANAVHQAISRTPTAELLRAVYHGALRIYLDRFLNVPAARLPERASDAQPPALADLQRCWDQEGRVEDAGAIVYRYLSAGGDPAEVIASLGHALLTEDAEFHWFQTYEAAVRQFRAWPAGSEEGALILAGTARFLAAHTPTRRELSQVVRIATRLGRGDVLFEEG